MDREPEQGAGDAKQDPDLDEYLCAEGGRRRAGMTEHAAKDKRDEQHDNRARDDIGRLHPGTVFAVESSYDRSKTITEVYVGYVKVDAHFPSHLVAEELAFTLEKFQSGPRAAI